MSVTTVYVQDIQARTLKEIATVMYNTSYASSYQQSATVANYSEVPSQPSPIQFLLLAMITDPVYPQLSICVSYI